MHDIHTDRKAFRPEIKPFLCLILDEVVEGEISVTDSSLTRFRYFIVEISGVYLLGSGGPKFVQRMESMNLRQALPSRGNP